MNNSGALQIINNLIGQLQMWWQPLHLISYFIGFVLVGIAVIKAHPNHKYQGSDAMLIIGSLVSGLFLLNLPGFLDALSYTFFQQNSVHELSSVQASGLGPNAPFVQLTVYAVQLFGLLGVVSGAIMFAKVGRNPDLLRPSLVRMGAGSMGVNFITFLKMIGVSFGGVVNTTINNII